jgi:hypothetical protein
MWSVLQFSIIIRRTWHNNDSRTVEFFWYFHLYFSGLASKSLHLWRLKSFGVWHFAIWWVVHDISKDPLMCWEELAQQHSVTSQMTWIFRNTTVRTWNLTLHLSLFPKTVCCHFCPGFLVWPPLFTPRHIKPIADLLCPFKQQPSCGNAKRVIKIILGHHVTWHLVSLLYLDHFMWWHMAQCYSTLPLFSFHAF